MVHGKWGFDDWEGPHYHLFSPQPGKWTLASGDQSALVVGRDDTLHFEGQSSVCVEKVEEQTSAGHALSLVLEVAQARRLEVTVPLKDAAPGPVNVAIYQYGLQA